MNSRKLWLLLTPVVLMTCAGALVPGYGHHLRPLMVWAQETGVTGPPSAEEQASFRQEFENRFGAPPEAAVSSDAAAVQPEFETPGEVPDYVKQIVPESDLVKIYCLMTRWKSGDLFSAMDSVKSNLGSLADKGKVIGIDLTPPDTDNVKSEGTKRLEAICASQALAEAVKQINDFRAWGTAVQNDLGASRQTIEAAFKAKGDDLRREIQSAVDAIVSVEKERITDLLDAEAAKLVSEKQSSLEGRTSPPSQSELDSIKADIESRLEIRAATEAAAIKAKVEAKVTELIGDKKAKFEEIGKFAQGIGQRVSADIKAGEPNYYKYRDQALALRKDVIMKVLEAKLSEGLAALEAAKDDLDKASIQDPTIKSVEEIKSELAADKEELGTKIAAALAAGDEGALQAALNGFRNKWEAYRSTAEKAASAGLAGACSAALEQFSSAKTQIDANMPRIKTLLDKCTDSTTEECLKINEFAPRLQIIYGKLDDLRFEIGMAEKMCQAPDQTDKDALMALMNKIRSDAEDAKLYGQALEAEKDKSLADSVDKICGQVLPQLEAGEAQLMNSDIASLQNNLAKCQAAVPAQMADFCRNILSMRTGLNDLLAKAKVFSADVDKVRQICRGTADQSALEGLSAMLGGLKTQGDELRQAGQDLRAQQESKAVAQAFCRAAAVVITAVRDEASAGLKLMKEMYAACTSQNDPVCTKVKVLDGEFSGLETQTQALLTKMASFTGQCAAADASKPPGQELLDALATIQKDGEALKTVATSLKSEAEAAAAGKGAVWIEAESAANFNVRTNDSAPMAREVRPTWRPPYYGDGSWYLGRGGDFLEFNFLVPAAGTYNIWIRDLASAIQSQWGVRRVTLSFDGKTVGTFEENTAGRSVAYPPGAFRWHKVGTVTLTAGRHAMKAVKAESSNGAADLDAFFLTVGSETPPEK